MDEEADFEGEFYRWRCPACEAVQDEEFDPRGDSVECDSCPWEGKVSA